MKALFDTPVSRRGTGSMKWDEYGDADNVIEMWVADMDLRSPDCIVDALLRRVEHGIFGYTAVDGSFYDALCGWFSRRHHWDIDRRKVIYTSGVVPAISAIIKAITRPGDAVAVMTPAYNCFFSSIRNNGCRLSDVPMLMTDDGYRIDFEALDAALSDDRTPLLILCNPHNPGGRVWSRDELQRVAEIAASHSTFVISDEIHCELTFPGVDYTPFAPVADGYALKYATCVSPSKAFNTAGLQIACIVTSDADTRRRVDRAINDNEVCDVNPFGVIGLKAAYNEGGEWLDALRVYLHDNYLRLARFIDENSQLGWKLTPMEGTYLAWVNTTLSEKDGDTTARLLLDRAGIRVSSGTSYGPGGEDFIRINLACPRVTLKTALERITDMK
ncbi:MAG: pyridoxal phosphate-dependent aminotransferase [Lachnoclostridium sp.]|nr:pyridoxal phosphate-dependent aminotransferase [Lachnoclostridium sp.]